MELLLDDNILGELTSFQMLRQNFGPNFFSHFRPIYDSTYNNASQFLLSRFSSRKKQIVLWKVMKLKTKKSLPRKFFADLHSRGEKSLTEETWGGISRLKGETWA